MRVRVIWAMIRVGVMACVRVGVGVRVRVR